MENRTSKISRKTGETDIEVSINLDGEGKYDINTGVGFFDHMLSLMAKHGIFDLSVKAKGDLYVDSHHTVEDVGIVIGNCIKEALKDKNGIKRYGTSFVPMDEALGTVSLDVSGRPFLVFDAEFTASTLGNYDTEMTEEFFRALAFNAGITLHAKVVYGKNNHHMIEALFKALGRALREAVTIDDKIKGVMSTKGCI
ncbi:MAG: imidazoleglycerol-phosphate dehydratase HisB [Bacillota bacterium]|nr:imidazoleglycerol-phosphate dehydratase HisB [Bacillota bacterium]